MSRPVPYGYCHCGCGEQTKLAPYNHSRHGWVKGEPLRYIFGHQSRGRENSNWRGGRKATGHGYIMVHEPAHGNADKAGYVLEHVLIASRALGRPLPSGTQVHHVNGDGTDNRPQNLVICPDSAYHHLLHRRQRALQACGHAGWLKCRFCQSWDNPENLYVARNGQLVHHRSCQSDYDYHRRNTARKG